ncbi:nicotinamide N-methyltransferas-like protein Nnt1 [Polychaeton citri CBS 116435]|uniref:Protein N-terminal and lysine N-methyltransferase EFM7 n=1 Tax=Polychaeton citri CBS 116435 TaxID=1314669 RepID=A0A9P4QIZ5_9PEZI|nr:nicotinamide N-methyltransferas-like protein Nnt1 [Polychaeton citri CBS 116435]
MEDSDGDDNGLGLFTEPEGFFRPEREPTTVVHQMLNGSQFTLRLVGHNPISQGHFLWNAGRTLADFIEANATEFVRGKTVLELGAGAGLPSLICTICGAARVVVTDYPDADLVDNLRFNIEHCTLLPDACKISAEGYLWGADNEAIIANLPASQEERGFDVLILADLLFNHSEHVKLVQSIQQNLKHSPEAEALVFFTPYRPWLLEKDLSFFELARAGGLSVRKIFEKVMDKVMFEEDPGDELLRRTVYGYRLQWAATESETGAA